MRRRGEDHVDALPRAVPDDRQEIDQGGPDGGGRAQRGQAEIRHNEVVPAASGVQPRTEVTEPRGHPAFDRRVDVLVGGVERERPAGDLLPDLAHGVLERLRIRRVEEARRLERSHVRRGRSHVLLRESDVEREGLGQPLRARIGRLGEPAAPERLAHCFRRSDQTLSGSPHRRMNPSAWRWSNRSPSPYVASPRSYSAASERRPTTVHEPAS